ncbi:MAG: DNA mismatch repair endonuclease MutL [Firmicutes bacterium]|nr:DNA mismatch repair endonuclease MutL [Bacillota bacterium]
MPRIHVLDERTANQIAAGEVVERPASVVKELVENSLDAGSRRIVVEVEGGGRSLIRVTDDGCGMDPTDARLALERHATSKIRTSQDLLRVTTLGFRGEALPSIASVSRLELRTREHGALSGTRIYVEGGRIAAVEEVGCAPGTRVEVRDLFFNTPARLKYLKSNATELSRIGEVLARLALARPDVSIRFRSGPAEVFVTPGSGDLLATAAAVLSRDLVRALVPVDYPIPGGRIWGYVGLPAAARASRSLQHFFVNRRPVQALAVRYALEEAYTNLIPQGRYPVALIFIDLDPAEVDVNVHPAKLEVRFQREREVRGAVYHAVRSALGAATVVPVAGEPAAPGGSAADGPAPAGPGPAEGREPLRPGGSGASPGTPPPQPGRDWVRAGTGMPPWARPAQARGQTALSLGGAYISRDRGEEDPAVAFLAREAAAALSPEAAPEAAVEAGPGAPGLPEGAAPLLPGGAPAADLRERIRNLRPLGQVHQTYIVCDGPEGLYVIDQHAAHERIYFERNLRAMAGAETPAQPLLFPVTLELSPAQYALLEEVGEELRRAGLDVRPFGGRTVVVRSVPMGVAEAHAARLVLDTLDRLAEAGSGTQVTPLELRRRAAAALAACKAAIKARDPLQPEAIRHLLAELAECEHPGQCPHGRPTILLFSIPELEKRFGRT